MTLVPDRRGQDEEDVPAFVHCNTKVLYKGPTRGSCRVATVSQN